MKLFLAFLALNCPRLAMHRKSDMKWMWLHAQTAFAAQLWLLRSSWKWLRKWDDARTSNMFPALPAGQDFQTCGGSDKDKNFFSINCRDAFLQREHSSTLLSWLLGRVHHYPPPSPTPELTKAELKGVWTDMLPLHNPHPTKHKDNLQIFKVFQIFKSPPGDPSYTIVV